MKKRKFTLEAGRCLVLNGEAIATLNLVTYNGVPRLSPVDADILAHRIVNALNHMEMIREKRIK